MGLWWVPFTSCRPVARCDTSFAKTTRLVGIMEKMETTINGLYWDNGKENGNYYNGVILG